MVLTPFEAFARGIAVEGLSAKYAAQATAALEAMSALREVRAAKSQLRERLMKLDPYGDEWHQASMQESLLWRRQREADHRAYIAFDGSRLHENDRASGTRTRTEISRLVSRTQWDACL